MSDSFKAQQDIRPFLPEQKLTLPAAAAYNREQLSEDIRRAILTRFCLAKDLERSWLSGEMEDLFTSMAEEAVKAVEALARSRGCGVVS